ncbi:MAG: hypothetical protein J6I65_01755 [Lachnospiraceae bacterium]|nr:hypothetical protein [Lachnospiraceae bacterium]
MKKEFEKGDHVVYGNSGVCYIEDVKEIKFDFNPAKRTYFILRPLHNPASVTYVPVDNEKLKKKMRYILSKEEIEEVLKNAEHRKIAWVEDKKKREEIFKKVLQEKNQEDMILLVSCIYMKREELIETGKKLNATDEAILKEAERFINDEFSFSLKLSAGQVGEYIQRKLKSE